MLGRTHSERTSCYVEAHNQIFDSSLRKVIVQFSVCRKVLYMRYHNI